MDKLTITNAMIPEIHVHEYKDKDGNVFCVKTCIPYAEKELMALELSAFLMVTDEERKMMYENYKSYLLEVMLIAKHYTNIDMTNMDSEENWGMLFDYLVMNGFYGQMMDDIRDDYKIVRGISERMSKPAMTAFDRENSLSFKVSNLFGDVLDREDIATALAKTDAVNNTMVDLIGAYNEKQQREAKKDLALQNGAVISLAKKKK